MHVDQSTYIRYSRTLTSIANERGTSITRSGVDFHSIEGRKTTSKFEFQAKKNTVDYMR